MILVSCMVRSNKYDGANYIMICDTCREEVWPEKASPVNVRESLEMVEALRKAGIDFIPIPATSKEERQAMIKIAIQKIEELETKCST